MYTVSEIYIYPIKSLGGIQLQSAVVTDRGLQHDRRWMLVDANNRFLTQRVLRKLALFQVALNNNGMEVVFTPNGDKIDILFDAANGQSATAQIWHDQCQVNFVSDEIDAWFSKRLAMSCRLAYMPSTSHRIVEETAESYNQLTSLSDAYPLLIIGQSSLDDLNNRLHTPVPMNRFRPNVVITGGAPYDEDEFRSFSINGISFYGIKPCGRCVVTTIDQQTAEQSAEPLKTLAKFRRVGNNVNFGQNLLVNGTGTIAVGQALQFS